ncbi:HD domain-containing protein [Candidatus Parcubacteria bacterium]|nr:HD domain-containing protein [Candidatus Parcubacteria bacterium]
MITLKQVKKNLYILEFIKQTEISLAALSFTEHGLRHSNLVADRARSVAKEIGLSEKEQELSAIAGFCHDMANFLSRTNHNYFGALLFQQVFSNDFSPEELVLIMEAISNHDKGEMNFTNPISAVVVLADKSDVHRSRVIRKVIDEIKSDIHDRVNFATKMSRLKIDKTKKRITLTFKIDTNFVPIMEYFEIFTNRMVYCRKAAKYLNYDFGLVINNFKLL